MSSTQDVRFSEGAIEEGRKLANKLWNVARLILAERGEARAGRCGRATLEERWILARLDAARAELEEALVAGSTSRAAAKALYHLTFDDFCDWYAEAIKPRLYDGDADAPRDGARGARAAAQAAPPGDAARDRGDLVAAAGPRARLIVSPWPEPDDALRRRPRRARPRAGGGRRSSGGAASASSSTGRAADLRRRRPAGAASGERRSRRRDRAAARRRSSARERMLANERFVANAPAEVVEAEREKLARYRRELDALGG